MTTSALPNRFGNQKIDDVQDSFDCLAFHSAGHDQRRDQVFY